MPDKNFLVGTWVGSFSGFIHNNPRHRRSYELPQLSAYLLNPSSPPPGYIQSDGFFVCSVLLGIAFRQDETLIGEFAVNAAGRLVSEDVRGSYAVADHENLATSAGSFSLTYNQSQGQNTEITQNFRFMARSPDDLHFLSLNSTSLDPTQPITGGVPHRPTIAQGTLHRVRFD